MTDDERRGRIEELLRMRALVADLVEGIDKRLQQLGYVDGEPARLVATGGEIADAHVVDAIRRRFALTGSPAKVPLLRSRKGRTTLTATLVDDGVCVDNLGAQPFLPWDVFRETVRLLIRNEGRGKRGNHRAPLGSPDLPLDSVEGHIARVVYGKPKGKSVFRRITPIACILIWAGLCEAAPGELVLVGARR